MIKNGAAGTAIKFMAKQVSSAIVKLMCFMFLLFADSKCHIVFGCTDTSGADSGRRVIVECAVRSTAVIKC